MFRPFDILVFSSAIISLLFSVFVYLQGDPSTAIFVGLWVPSILGFGIHIKLLRIVHFVLYKNLDKTRDDND